MNPESDQHGDRLLQVFDQAKLQPVGEERQRFLAEACSGDASLQADVAELLRAHEDAGSFLKPASAVSPELEVEFARLKPEESGDRIGNYKLLQQIGQGGFGTVWMAEQTQPVKRRVALKIIKLGMDIKEVVARFEQERQALALMDHPNIARVFDAGATPTGRPFFVMELVRGIKITDYCDEAKLRTEERLQLFVAVCHAVQHAHQKGIIHRDLKPSNILVTLHDGVPVPKVIDFGVAKATQSQRLTDLTLFTQFEQMIGTPLYMSPEQAEMSGLDIDTRSDIYSLGVLLYELLVGRTPFDPEKLMKAGHDEMRRVIREEEPPKPSTALSTMRMEFRSRVAQHRQVEPTKIAGLVRGDLDWIVMKCLEKDRARRYETPNALAEDIRRHLEHEPVVACPPSRWYEFKKTVRRHQIGFAAAAAVIVALAIGLGIATWQYFEKNLAYQRTLAAEKEQSSLRQIAETKEKRSEEVARFLKDMLQGVGPSVAAGRDTTMLKEILDNTAGRLKNELANSPEVEAELRGTIGWVYWELAEYGQAESMYRRSLELLRQIREPTDVALADTLHNLAEVLRRNGNYPDSEAMAREALGIYEKRYGREHAFVGATLNLLGFVVKDRGNLAGGEAMLREALAINRKTAGEEHPQVGLSLSRLGHVLERQNKLDAAESALRDAVRIQRKGLGTSYLGLVDSHVELGWTLNYLSVVLARQGRLAEAEMESKESMAMMRTVLADNHRDSFSAISNVADILGKQGKRDEVESLYRDLVARVKNRFGNVHRAVGDAMTNLARALEQQRKFNEAEAVWREELLVERQLSGDDHPFVANSLLNLATFHLRAHQPEKAEPPAKEALAIRRKRLGNDHAQTLGALKVLGSTLMELQRYTEAEQTFREILRIGKKSSSVSAKDLSETLGWIIKIKIAQGQTDEAVHLLQEIIEVQREKHRDGSYPSEDADPIYSVLNTLLSTRALDAAEQVANSILTPAIEAEPRSVWFVLNRGRLFARTSRFKEAVRDFEKVVELEPANHQAWYALTTLLAELADVPAFDELRRRMLARFADLKDPFLLERTAKGCLLMPATGPELDAAAALARKSAASSGNQPPNPYLALARGLAEYRQEHYEEAERWVRHVSDNDAWSPYPNLTAPGNLLFAMTLQRRGNPVEARTALAKGAKIVTQSWPGSSPGDLGSGWHDLLIARTLLREATSTVETVQQKTKTDPSAPAATPRQP